MQPASSRSMTELPTIIVMHSVTRPAHSSIWWFVHLPSFSRQTQSSPDSRATMTESPDNDWERLDMGSSEFKIVV